jgi:hypothetical protein
MSTCAHHQFIIDEVGDLDRLPVETSRHVDACDACARFGRDLIALRALLREPERIAPPSDFDLRVAERLRAHKAASGGARAWAARNQRYLAAAACLVITVTTAISFRAVPSAEPPPVSGTIAFTVSSDEPLRSQLPAIPSDEESGGPASGQATVAYARESRSPERRTARHASARRGGGDDEVRIYVQDSAGARVVSFEPVIYGAHEILPVAVATSGRADSSTLSSF